MGEFFSLVSLQKPSKRSKIKRTRRRYIPEAIKRNALIRSKGKCECKQRGCKKILLPETTEFHHWNGDPSDNRKRNVKAVRSDCHKKLTAKQAKRRKRRARIKRVVQMDFHSLIRTLTIASMPIYRFVIGDIITAQMMCGVMIMLGLFSSILGIKKNHTVVKGAGKIFIAAGIAILIIIAKYLGQW